MKISKWVISVGSLCCFSWGPTLNASVIFENPWNGAQRGNCTFQCDAVFGGADYIGAENFSVVGTATITSLAFEAYYEKVASLSGLNVNWGIWADAGSTPTGGALFSGSVTPLVNNLGVIDTNYDRVEIVLDVPDFVLPGSNYWVGFDVNVANGGFALFWAETDIGDGLSAQSSDGGVTWPNTYAFRDNQAWVFSVRGSATSVPVPATLALLGLGLLGLRLRRRA